MINEPFVPSTGTSALPPKPLVSVTVTGLPGRAVVALTARAGPVTVSVWVPEVPPPGAGVKTVTEAVPGVAAAGVNTFLHPLGNYSVPVTIAGWAALLVLGIEHGGREYLQWIEGCVR